MLEAIRVLAPGIYKFCHAAYSNTTILAFNNRVILSQEGTQQGDPLGALLFCATLQPILTCQQCELIFGYMDDVSLGGPENLVAANVKDIEQSCANIGLELNESKCEIITNSGTSNHPQFSKYIQLTPINASLLGAPMLPGPMMDRMLQERCDDIERATNRLQLLPSHDAMILLKASLCAPKIQHILRSSPCAGNPKLEMFDEHLKRSTNAITNSDLTDAQWAQASMPIKDGGLGIRRATPLALSAFLASAAGTHELQEMILAKSSARADQQYLQAQAEWVALNGPETPPDHEKFKQSRWEKPGRLREKESLNMLAHEPADKARILAITTPHSSDWLNALPISACGLRLDNEAVRVAVGLRLGVPLCTPHTCHCGSKVDERGTHGLSCKRSTGRTIRHAHINDIIWRALVTAKVPATKEPAGLSRSDGKRPDGVTLIPWSRGKCLTWDVTVADTLAESYRQMTATTAGSAAENAAIKKCSKYIGLSSQYAFTPIACETFGPINKDGKTLIGEIGKRLTAVTGDIRETAFLFQRISMTIQRFNAVAFSGSLPVIPTPEAEW